MTETIKEELTYVPIDDAPEEFPDYPLDPPIVQAELTGEWFRRDVAHGAVRRDGKKVPLHNTQKVRVMAGVGGEGNEFQTLDEIPVTITPSDFRTLPVDEARISRTGGTVYDRTDDAHRSLETVRSHGASKPGTKVIPGPGAIPGHQVVKPRGSFRTKIGRKIETAIRKKNALRTA
jgi:hypothetical protein